MSDDSKKNQHKGKHEAKEQRKPRQSKQNADKSAKKKDNETKVDAPTKVPVPLESPKPPVEPGPEFYKNLKRETDDILKITEEANTKYKKKEIQSNWTKYEMPIESYEEMEEQENLGANYEELISTPLSVGGHFQFKHEKTWDVNTGPSLYDKYFDTNMENLATAISTLPFYERNGIDINLFTETDMLTMKNRAVKYKRKYYKDKFYTTPEIEAMEKAIECLSRNEDKLPEVEESKESESESISLDSSKNICSKKTELKVEVENLEVKMDSSEIRTPEPLRENSKQDDTVATTNSDLTSQNEEVDNLDDILQIAVNTAKTKDLVKKEAIPTTTHAHAVTSKDTERPAQDTQQVKPIIESPEDLEKWLDDFLDG